MSDDAPPETNSPPPPPAESAASTKPVERLFPFVLRARALIVGRETLRRSKSKLHFVLITRDISDASRTEILADFAPYPIVQHFAAEDLEKHFNIRGAKVIGFAKSGLAQSIYAELKEHRINKPLAQPKPGGPAAAPAETGPGNVSRASCKPSGNGPTRPNPSAGRPSGGR